MHVQYFFFFFSTDKLAVLVFLQLPINIKNAKFQQISIKTTALKKCAARKDKEMHNYIP